jgi:hypothetical protein
MSFMAQFSKGFQHAAPPPEADRETGLESSTSIEHELAVTAAGDGALDALKRVGHPGAESTTGRQEPASIDLLAANATSAVVAVERETTARVHAHAGRYEAIEPKIAELSDGARACEARLAEVAHARHSYWGRLFLVWLALVVGGVGALEVTMNNLALRWLSLPELEYRVVAVVVSLAIELGAVALAVKLRDGAGRSQAAPLWLRIVLGGIVATLAFSVGLLVGIPRVIDAGHSNLPATSSLVALGCLAALAGLLVAALRRWSLIALFGIVLIGGGLLALTALRTDKKVMIEASPSEIAFGTFALGAAAIAATYFVFVLTEKLLACHAENAAAEHADRLRADLDAWNDLERLASIVRDSYPATLEEIRHDGLGRVREVAERFERDAHTYAQAAQRAHAEAAPDISRQVAHLAADIAADVVSSSATIDRIADEARASSRMTTPTEQEA